MSVESALAVKGYKRIKGIGRGSYGYIISEYLIETF